MTIYGSVVVLSEKRGLLLKNGDYKLPLCGDYFINHETRIPINQQVILVGGWTTQLKNMLVKMGSSSPIFGVKIPKNIWVATT